MAEQIKVSRLATLPTEANEVVFKKGDAGEVIIVVTGTDATDVRSTLAMAQVVAAINSAISDAKNVHVVDDIAERDALVLPRDATVYVKDAVAESGTVNDHATYAYDATLDTFTRTDEGFALSSPAGW